jgi:hypothetical protein
MLALILASGILYSLIGANLLPGASGVLDAFRLAAELIVFAVAAAMGYVAARQFERGVRTRLTWILISVGAALFFVADVGLYLAAITGPSAVANFGLLLAVGAITLSRVLLAFGLWMVIRVYHDSGLPLRLTALDYAAMIVLGSLNFLTIVFGANTVRLLLSHTAADLTHWIIMICLPLPPGLAVCSVFAIIIWRYTRQMGGGLVAKAWSGVLLYMVVLPVRTLLLGLSPYIPGQGNRLTWMTGVISFLGLSLAGWALYLGASYQYEASTRTVPTELEYSSENIETAEPKLGVRA